MKTILDRIFSNPKTTGAAIAAVIGMLVMAFQQPEMLKDTDFVGQFLAAAAIIYGLFEARDAANSPKEDDAGDQGKAE